MRIHELQKSKWLKDKARRKGRWNATGTGNYSGKGLKGQKSRSGHSMKPFFEGWQTSIVQRLPKARGFKRYYKLVKQVHIINLGTLDADQRIADTMEITKKVLKDLWYISSEQVCVKILGNGDYAKHLTFGDIDAFSAAAQQKIATPGTVHSVAKKAPAKVVRTPKRAATPVAKKAPVKVIEKDIVVASEAPTTPVVKKTPVKKTLVKKETTSAKSTKPAAKKPVAKKTK